MIMKLFLPKWIIVVQALCGSIVCNAAAHDDEELGLKTQCIEDICIPSNYRDIFIALYDLVKYIHPNQLCSC